MAEGKVWSAYQEAVFDFVRSGTGNAIVRAVPGSGKTTTIVEAANLVPRGKKAVFVAFNSKIAEELKSRLPPSIPAMTLHSFGLRALRRVRDVDVQTDKGDRLVREVLASWDMGRAVEDVEMDPYASYDNVRLVKKAVGLAKGMLAHRRDFLDLLEQHEIESSNLTPQQIAEAMLRAMLAARAERNVVDYDDMIWMPCIDRIPIPRYDYVFVDETQDLNASKIQIVLKAAEGKGRVIAVGDPRQSIYAFAGADITAMQKVEEALDAKCLPLSISYRCPRKVVAEAQRIEPTIEASLEAPEGIVRTIDVSRLTEELKGGDFVVSRLNAPIVSICFRLISQGRPAYVQGREIGQNLSNFIVKSKAETVEELLTFVKDWHALEVARLLKLGREIDSVNDKRACIEALAVGARSLDDIHSAIEHVFAETEDRFKIRLSSTHRAKGLEADRVFVLRDTYWGGGENGDGGERRLVASDSARIEEENLLYVAITRAKKELVYVAGKV
jgi:DNA helicase-2/ATP-dependent DNA helicase PcrA